MFDFVVLDSQSIYELLLNLLRVCLLLLSGSAFWKKETKDKRGRNASQLRSDMPISDEKVQQMPINAHSGQNDYFSLRSITYYVINSTCQTLKVTKKKKFDG